MPTMSQAAQQKGAMPMNYDTEIQKLIATIKADKSVIQPWRNKAMARLEDVQAFVRMGKTSAPSTWPELPPVQYQQPGSVHGVRSRDGCVCVEGLPWDANCPIHGL